MQGYTIVALLVVVIVAPTAHVGAILSGAADPAPSMVQSVPEMGGLQGLRSYQTTVISLDLVKSAIDRGAPFELILGGEPIMLSLRLNNMRDPSFVRIDENGQQVRPSDPATYKGYVVGDSYSDVRLGIGPSGVEAYVRTNQGTYFVEPLARYRPGARSDEYVVYRNTEFETWAGLARGMIPHSIASPLAPVASMIGKERPRSQSFSPSSSVKGPAPSSTVGGLPRVASAPGPRPMESSSHTFPLVYMARIMLSSDQQFRSVFPNDHWYQMEVVLNNVEGIYARDVGVEFRIVREDALTLGATTAASLLNEYEAVENADPSAINTARNLAHLFSGKDLYFFFCDGKLGASWPNSLAVAQTPMPANNAYSVSQQVWYIPGHCEWYWTATAYERMIVSAHEMGHVFGGAHEAAVQDPPGFASKWTIMGDGPSPHDHWDYFSDGTLDSGKNNVLNIRGLAGERISSLYTNNVAAWRRSGAHPASSCASPGYPSDYAFDESMSTYFWASTTPCTLVSFFASTYKINKFAIREFSSSYLITSLAVYAIMPDDTEIPVNVNTAVTQFNYVDTFKVMSAKGIRLDINAVCCGATARVVEFEAYATENLALQAYGGVASSTGDLWQHTPDLANDGNLGTYWWADRTPGELTILFDKANAVGANPRPYYISQIVVRGASGYSMADWEFDVLGSNDVWTFVFADWSSQQMMNIFVVAGSPFWIKGIRFKVVGPTCCGGLNTFGVIREFEAYADNSEPATDPTLWVNWEN